MSNCISEAGKLRFMMGRRDLRSSGVFISYRIQEHRQFVPRIAAALRAEGIDVATDIDTLPRFHKNLKLAASLPQATGVPNSLYTALLNCDVCVVLVGSGANDSEERWEDFADICALVLLPNSLLMVPLAYESALRVGLFKGTTIWYKNFYGFDMEKSTSETWQQWEERVGQFFGLSVVRVYLAPSARDVAMAKSFGLQVVGVESLEEDTRYSLTPLIRSLPRGRKKPKPYIWARPLFAAGRGVEAGVAMYDKMQEMYDVARKSAKRTHRRTKA